MNNETNRKYGIFLNMANMLVSFGLALIYTPILLYCLGKSEYGVYSLALSIISFLSILDLGLGNALVRYSARYEEENKPISGLYGLFLTFYLIISLITTIVGVILYFNVESFFASSFTPQECIILRRVLLVLLINTVLSFPASVFSSIIRTHEKFIFANTLNLLSTILLHIINITLLIIGYKSFEIVLVSLILNSTVYLIQLYYCFRRLKIKITFAIPDKELLNDILKFSFFIFLNIVIDNLYSNTDKIILGKVSGSVAVAVYNIGIVFYTYFMQFSVSISSLYLPYISKLSVQENSRELMSNLFNKIGRIQQLLLIFILFGFIAYGNYFISLWAGEGFEDSYIIALLIMIPSLVPLTQNIGVSILQALNKHKTRSVMYLGIAIINIIISIPLAMKLGGIGAAIGTLISNIMGQILFMNFYYSKVIGIDIKTYWKNLLINIIKYIPILLVFFITTIHFDKINWLILIMRIMVGVIISIPYIYLVILNKEEKDSIRNYLCKLKLRR